ncbi:leucine-rich repeat protein [Ruminococcus albus]|uniref:Leucine rich repeat-containing protein n=1 Tax=Ruminococcus albus TaxID=1264 RepID=A0A1H7JI88_RUMAL|nr:leucine-rich repeat protein [Ruminococcus albus]SEK73587.1 Leucine rich repeat-containing protein [Ruminococcus albus]
MNNKKIVAGLLALSFVFGGTALPNTVVNNSVVASASEEDAEVLTYGDYKYILREDGTAEIVEGHFSADEVKIPGEINGAVVTSIGEDAFDCNYFVYVKSVVIPDSVTEIKEGAFAYCRYLESITLSKNLKCIGSNAFFGCELLNSIDIPDSVTEIKDHAFYDCVSLENVTLSKNLKYMHNVFSGCSKIKSIVIPDGTKSIVEYAFVGLDNLETIDIPDSVEYIGEFAFLSCTNLKSITLPEGLKQIDIGAFMLCESLESIVIPDSVESIDDAAFESCESLENVVIPDSVKTIGGAAFLECHNLKSITIPASVTEIGEDAFSEYDTHDDSYKPLKNVTINCYSGSYAEKYAKEKGLNYKLIDEKLPNCPPPKRMVIKAELSEEYHQIRLRWKPYDNAEKYGIAVYLSGKWRVWTCSIPADVTVFTSPKNLTPGKTYKVAVAARVNGEWNVRDALFDAVTVTVK